MTNMQHGLAPSPKGNELTWIRETRETKVSVSIRDADNSKLEPLQLKTGIPFLDHMLGALRINLGRKFGDFGVLIDGDLDVDDHHTVEDCALALGEALRGKLGLSTEKHGLRIARYGSALVPMDDALARVAVDVCGRAFCSTDLRLKRECIGGVAAENYAHFFLSFSQALKATIHVDVLKGVNDHHRIESAFKGLGTALALALTVVSFGENGLIDSTKGEVRR